MIKLETKTNRKKIYKKTNTQTDKQKASKEEGAKRKKEENFQIGRRLFTRENMMQKKENYFYRVYLRVLDHNHNRENIPGGRALLSFNIRSSCPG